MLLCVAAAEILVRAVWSPAHPKRPQTYTFNAETGLVHLPNHYQLPFVRCLADQQPECQQVFVKYTINADGWRGPQNFRQPAGRPLIVVTGDSQIEAQPVDDENLATVLLEKSLQARFPNAEVRNVAITSAGFVQYYAMWRKFIAPMKPDVLVVAAVGANDFRNCSTTLETFQAMRPYYTTRPDGLHEAHFEPVQQARVSAIRLWLSRAYESLELARFNHWRKALQAEGERSLTTNGGDALPPDVQIYENPPAPEYAEAIALGREYLTRLITEARTAGTRVIVLGFPWQDEALDEKWAQVAAAYQKTGRTAQVERRRPENIIREIAQQNGAEFVSLADAVHRLPPDEQRKLWHSQGDNHLNARGQQFLAQTLDSVLLATLDNKPQ